MSYIFSRALVEEFSPANCSGTDASAPSNTSPMPRPCLWHDRTMEPSRLSRFGMTCAIDIFTYQRKIGAWTKNTDTAKSATALYAGSHSSHETKGACNNAAQTLVAGLFRQRRRPALARSAECNFFHLDLNTKPVPVHAGRCCASLAERPIRWLKSESALLSSVARSLQGVCATRQTELLRFSGIRLKHCGLILKRISSQECHGTTTEKGMTNGA